LKFFDSLTNTTFIKSAASTVEVKLAITAGSGSSSLQELTKVTVKSNNSAQLNFIVLFIILVEV
jgi:hypothetical protein